MLTCAISEPPGSARVRRPTSRRADLLEIRSRIERQYAERLTLEGLARGAGLSVFRLVTLFRQHFGVSPYRYLSMVRVQAAEALLIGGTPSAIVAIEVGFCDQSHLCRHFRSLRGMTPCQFLAARKIQRGSAGNCQPARGASR
jgi:AraC-like DNA-binding protein